MRITTGGGEVILERLLTPPTPPTNMTTKELAEKRGRKFLCTTHITNQEEAPTEEQTRKEIEKIDGIKFIGIALEVSDGGRKHLQYYIETMSQTSGKALSRKLNKHNRAFWNSAHCEYAVAPNLAQKYIGNLDFQHSNGKDKGGDVLWKFVIGEPYKANDGQKAAQKLAWKNRLMEMKGHIDNGKDIFYLWENYFLEMIQTNRAFREYVRDKASQGDLEEAKDKTVKGEISDLKEEIRVLREVNERLSEQNWRLRAEKEGILEVAKTQQDYIEAIQ